MPVSDPTSPAEAPRPQSPESASVERPPTVVRAPLDGQVIALSQAEDEAFAQGMIGPGVAIRPRSYEVRSPVDGEVVLVFRTRHAVALRTSSGVEILVHVGQNTVHLRGDGFETLVEVGATAEVGTPLLRFDPEALTAAGYPLTTAIVVANAHRVGPPVILAAGEVQAGDELFYMP